MFLHFGSQRFRSRQILDKWGKIMGRTLKTKSFVGSLFLALTLLVTACQGDGFSNLDILGGKTDQDSVSVVALRIELNNGLLRTCTGIAVTESKVLTAANCVYAGGDIRAESIKIYNKTEINNIEQEVAISESNEFAVKLGFQPPQNGLNGGSLESGPDDIAVIKLERSISTKSITISNDAVQPGDEVKLVGYGLTSAESASESTSNTSAAFQRNQATNSVDEVGNGMFSVSAQDISNSSGVTGNGDAGSPIFNASNQLIGIAVGGGYISSSSQYVSAYVDTTRQDVQDFISGN